MSDPLSDMPPMPHPEFGLAEERAIDLPAAWRDRRTADFLAHCVTRNPRDLRAHARRIAMHRALGDEGDVAAAVVDLFIVLGDKGGSLKRLMLDRHAAELRRSGCHAALAAAIDGALSVHAPDVALPASIFCRPAQGDFDLVREAGPALEDLTEEELRHQLAVELARAGLASEAAALLAE